MKSYVNLGCGQRYHPDWTNIDVAPQGPGILKHDLSRNIPLPNESCAVVYHSAVLEHMRRSDALRFLKECWRILSPGGILRVAVPDLEKLCRLYLEKLAAAVDGDPNAAHDYDWILLELYDQTVRESPGGDMLTYLQQHPLPNEDFVFERIGEEGRRLVQELKAGSSHNSGKPSDSYARQAALAGRRVLIALRKHLWSLMLGSEGRRALEIGRFRRAGEVHQWVYDRYSLSRLLLAAGFQDPITQTATTSQVPGWACFSLDTLPDGTIVKPDCFYMEARKPEH
jgi:SAM-dependent methyltransferase